jgi:hypothetical protein
MLLFFGWEALIWQPIALTYGRRGTALLSLLFTVVRYQRSLKKMD